MVDLVVTPANVAGSGNATLETGLAGATILAGQVVYREAATGLLKLADTNSVTVEQRTPYGIAMHGSLANQPLTIARSGPITIGSTLVAGQVYCTSETPGGIQPVADLGAGELTSVLGVATSTTVLDLRIHSSGVVL